MPVAYSSSSELQGVTAVDGAVAIAHEIILETECFNIWYFATDWYQSQPVGTICNQMGLFTTDFEIMFFPPQLLRFVPVTSTIEIISIELLYSEAPNFRYQISKTVQNFQDAYFGTKSVKRCQNSRKPIFGTKSTNWCQNSNILKSGIPI